MRECVSCPNQTTNRRKCKQCLIEEAYAKPRTDGGPTRTVEVVCVCGFSDEWDPSVSPYDTHEHDDRCEETTRYQAVGNDGPREPPRTPAQRLASRGGGGA